VHVKGAGVELDGAAAKAKCPKEQQKTTKTRVDQEIKGATKGSEEIQKTYFCPSDLVKKKKRSKKWT